MNTPVPSTGELRPPESNGQISPTVDAELVEVPTLPTAAPVLAALVQSDTRPGLLRRVGSALRSSIEWVFGIFVLLLGLAILASIPILSFLSLGYLLEVSGRIARTGRIRDGFIGVRKAARVGSIVVGTWLMILPLRALSDLWYSSQIIAPDSRSTLFLRLGLVLATVLIVLHVIWAWFRGGRLRHFFWPAPVKLLRRLRQGQIYTDACDRVWEFTQGLRLPYYFWLGLRGFVGAAAWLSVPVLLLILGFTAGGVGGALIGVAGALALGAVIFYLSFLETHFAATNRMRAMFDLQYARQAFRKAPVAFWIAMLITLASAIPLYLLKIELTPRQATWLPSLFFVAFIAPARLVTGWAVARAEKRDRPRHFLIRWGMRLAQIPVVGIYVLIVAVTPFLTWNGKWGLFEQHAFLLPVPFFGN